MGAKGYKVGRDEKTGLHVRVRKVLVGPYLYGAEVGTSPEGPWTTAFDVTAINADEALQKAKSHMRYRLARPPKEG